MSDREQSLILLAKLVERLAENGVFVDEVSSHELFEQTPTDSQVQLFIDLVEWLEAEGVVRAKNGCSGTIENEFTFDLVLTSRGFWLLSQKYNTDLTLGAAISQINESSTMQTGIGDFIGGILGGFTKSISG